MGELNNLNFTVGNVPWKIFRVNAIFFAAFGRAGEPLPTAQLAALAAELDRNSNRKKLYGHHQSSNQRTAGQNRLLRPGHGRQDDQPRAGPRPRADRRRQQRQARLAGHQLRPHAVLRLPAHRSHVHQGLQDQVPALHRARPGDLQHHPPARACAAWTASSSSPIRSTRRWPRTSRASRTSKRTCKILKLNLADIPYVLQYNKRDLPNVAPVEYMEFLLNNRDVQVPSFASVAHKCEGVFETLNMITRMLLNKFISQGTSAVRMTWPPCPNFSRKTSSDSTTCCASC